MRRILEDGGDLIDVFTHHLYPSYALAFEVTWDLDIGSLVPWGSPSVRSVLQEEGWWGRPFWLTETGVESAEHGEGDQAVFFDELLEDWFGRNPEAEWMDRIFFYEMTDAAAPADFTFGIIHGPPDFHTKLAFFAYLDFVADAVVDDAEIATHAVPAFIAPGSIQEIPVHLRNTGTTTWTAAEGYVLEAGVASDGWVVEPGLLPPTAEVGPGATVEVVLRLSPPSTAPPQPIPVVLTARMVDGRTRLFGDALRQTMTFTQDSPPDLLAHPASVTVRAGGTTVFRVAAISDTPLLYRWRRNSVELADDAHITGSDTPELRISEVDHHLEGDYDCVLTNDAGSVLTQVATLTLGISSPRRADRRLSPADRSAHRREFSRSTFPRE